MIKKYFALSLIAASIAVAGCSDDDDDDGVPGTDPVVPGVESPAATPGVGGTVYDTIVQSADHTMLRDAIDAAGLANTLDDESLEFTVFAPDNAAFEALETAPTGDDLLRTLDFHVLVGTFDSVTLAELVSVTEGDATLPTLLDGASLTFTTSDEGQGLAVEGTPILTADLYPTEVEAEVDTTVEGETDTTVEGETDTPVEGETDTPVEGEVDTTVEGETETTVEFVTTGVVHSIGAVLTAPEAVDTPDEGTDPVVVPGDGTVSEGAGTAQAALESAGNYTSFLALFGPQSYDDAINVWTVFAPTDEAIAASTATADAQNHIVTTGAMTVEDLIAAGSITSNSGNSFTVTGTDESDLMIGGSAATLLATGDGGALVYSLDGVLVP